MLAHLANARLATGYLARNLTAISRSNWYCCHGQQRWHVDMVQAEQRLAKMLAI
jgi:hypothetical protein